MNSSQATTIEPQFGTVDGLRIRYAGASNEFLRPRPPGGCAVSNSPTGHRWTFETITVLVDGPVLIAEVLAPPINLLGPALVRDLVSLIQRAEAADTYKVMVFKSGDPDFFISHVDLTQIPEYRQEAAKLTGFHRSRCCSVT